MSKDLSTSKPGHRDDSAKQAPGPLLRFHRDTVESTAGMSTAVLLGSGFAVAMGIFAWLGVQWDAKHGTEPWGVLAGVGLAFLYGGYEVWKIIRISDDVRKKEVKGRAEDLFTQESGGDGT